MCVFGKLIRKENKSCLLQCANLENKNKKEKLDRVTYKSRNMMTKQDNMTVQFLLLIYKYFFLQVSTSILSPSMIPIQAENKGFLEKQKKSEYDKWKMELASG